MAARFIARAIDVMAFMTIISLMVVMIVYVAQVSPSRGLAGLANGLIAIIMLIYIVVDVVVHLLLYLYKYWVSIRLRHHKHTWIIVSALLHMLSMVLPVVFCIASFEMYAGGKSWKMFVQVGVVHSILCILCHIASMSALPFVFHTKKVQQEVEHMVARE